MKLTGKTKEDFQIFIESQTNISSMYSFRSLPESCQNALIIDFFDSVEMYIKIYPHLGGGQAVFYPSFCFRDEHSHDNERNVLFDTKEQFYALTRLEAQNEVIKFTNEIYNSKHK